MTQCWAVHPQYHTFQSSQLSTWEEKHILLQTQKTLHLLFPSTPPFLFSFSKNSQMSFTWEAVICNCYFISALCYHFPFARINISVGIQHTIITFIAWASAFLREHLSSLKIRVLCHMLEAISLAHLGKHFQNSQAWKNESSVFSD